MYEKQSAFRFAVNVGQGINSAKRKLKPVKSPVGIAVGAAVGIAVSKRGRKLSSKSWRKLAGDFSFTGCKQVTAVSGNSWQIRRCFDYAAQGF